MATKRFPNSVYGQGDEADARFSLANERTFLAWIRTSLALIAAGVALEALKIPVQEGLRFAAAAIFVALGILAPIHAWISWMRVERSLRLNRPLPAPALSGILAAGVVLAAALVAVGMFL
ncbi:YidH family protein [Leifsonia sp. A12D58]|uniref:YidH family protein n=1 Tax=Leifsonia sp. A12D58 TaxID=3397674 RepID=UPI0039E0CD12